MKMRLLSAAVLISALPLFAQGTGPMPGEAMQHGPMGGGPMAGGPMGGGFGFGMRTPVTNAPYSATFTSTSTEKLQDGSVITHTTTRVASRDSLGRTREEITLPAHGTETTPRTEIVILDPVAHTITRLETGKKVAIVHQIPTPGEGRRGPGGPPPALSGVAAPSGTPHMKREDKNVVVADLGSSTISGDLATGKKTTRTIPAGTMGNSAPIVSTHEEWFSSDLKIELTRSDVDPFHGNRSTSVTGLTKAEPAATLFTVPASYTLQTAPERAGRGLRRGDGPPPPPSGM